VMTYEEDKIAHMRMEFGFDVLEVAKGNYASPAYQAFIGFKVDTTVLSKAFFETYGLTLNQVFNNHLSRAVETFRWIVANILPTITKAAWSEKKNTIEKKNNEPSSKHFYYKMRQKQYDKQYGKGYQRPGFSANLLSVLIRVLPKVGPLRALKFKVPTPKSEKLFDESFDTVLLHYAANVNLLKSQDVHPQDLNFDTGKPTRDCVYNLADQTYSEWLVKLKADQFNNVTTGIKDRIVNYFHLTPTSTNMLYSKQCAQFYNACNDILKVTPEN
jgi:hypothetical protein